MFIVRRIPLSNSKPLAELKKFNSGDLLPSVTRQPEYIMLNKGSNKKGNIDLLSRWSYDFFARRPLSLFIPRAKYPHHGVRAKPGGGLESQN